MIKTNLINKIRKYVKLGKAPIKPEPFNFKSDTYFVSVKEGERDAKIVLCYKKNNQYYSHYKDKLIEDCLICNVACLM